MMGLPLQGQEFSRRRILGGGAMLATGIAAGFPFPAVQARKFTPQEWANVSRLARSYVIDGKVANMIAALAQGDDVMLLLGGGKDTLGGQRPSDADSLYRIYSMTKPITGMAAMMLIDEGRMSLDQPLHTILPRFKDMRVQKVYDGAVTADNLEPAKRPITIRHLLTHTAGLGYSIIQKGPLALAMAERGVSPGQFTRLNLPAFSVAKPAPSLEVFADRAAELPLVYQPGTRWSYSIALDIMGRVIEVVSGKPFDQFLRERIFEPCGMASTGFQVAKAEQYRLTSNYGVLAGLLLPLDPAVNSIYFDRPAFPFGGSGLVSSPRDYDRFLHMLANYGVIDGRRVMSENAVRMGTSDLFPTTMNPNDTMRRDYGFGAGGRVGKGATAGTFGWAGAAGTIGFVDMKRGLRMGLFSQYMPMEVYPLLDQFPAAVLADLAAMKGLS